MDSAPFPQHLQHGLEPDLAAQVESVDVAGLPLLAFPRGRHNARHAQPRALTIGVPVRNGKSTLRALLASLAGQTDRDFDVVVIDNGSDDGTFALACRIAAAQDNVTIYANPHAIDRIGHWNQCLDLATGALVKLLLPNDILDHEYVARVGGLLRADATLAVAGCSLARLEPNEQVHVSAQFAESRTLTGAQAFLHTLLAENANALPSALVMRRSLLEQHRLRFNPRTGVRADLELLLRLLGHGDLAYERAPLVAVDTTTPRFFTEGTPVERFRSECDARVQGARAWPHALPTDLLVALGRRLSSLYDGYRKDVEDVTSVANLAQAYAAGLRSLGDLIDERAARALAAAAPVDVPARLADAERKVANGQNDQAEAILGEVLSAAPWHAEGLNDLGVLRFSRGALAGARRCFEAALESDAGFSAARDNLASLNARNGVTSRPQAGLPQGAY